MGNMQKGAAVDQDNAPPARAGQTKEMACRWMRQGCAISLVPQAPVFVQNVKSGAVSGVCWTFNAWGELRRNQRDDMQVE